MLILIVNYHIIFATLVKLEFENFFVTMPDEQSNIDVLEDRLTNPYYPPVEADPDMDMVFYFALALVLLGFAEWWLKSRENI